MKKNIEEIKMKVINLLILSLFVLVFPLSAMGGSEDETTGVSGTIEGGLRLLQVEDGESELEFTIYRGDYIIFNFETAGSYEFKMPGLEIDEVMPKPSSEKPYVKMKKSGDYSFTLGERRGVFHVLELEASSYHELAADEAAALINNVNPVIIDVRTEGEYTSGHIPGANLLPVQVFADNLGKLEKFKDDDILLYCASGNRSTVAAKMLIDAGYSKVYNLRRGIGDWTRNGLPIE